MTQQRVFEQAERSSVRTDDGADLAVWVCGEPGGQAVVLLHGFSLDHGTWGPVAGRLVEAGLRVIAPDLRGHGESTLGTDPPTVDRFVSDVLAVVEQSGVTDSHVVGHSLGAVIALAARLDGRIAPAGVAAISGTEQAVQNPVMRLGARLFGSRFGIWALQRKRSGRLMISTWFGPNASTDQLDWVRLLSASCASTTRAAVTTATADVDLRPSFPVAGPPALVVCGRLDKATPLKVSQSITSKIAGAELAAVDDAGHMVIIEQPDTVARLLIDFTAPA